jgi:tetratricopeptide (TPR) repeat protein
MSKLLILPFLVVLSIPTFAQAPRDRSPLDPTVWGVVYDVPETKRVTVRSGVTYFKDATSDLQIDIYSPPGAKSNQKRPAVIFLNAIGDRPDNKVKSWAIYSSWPRLIAAHDMIGISMDADGSRIQESLKALFAFIESDGAKYGIDASRLGVYAASANVTQSSIYLMSDSAAKGIKAVALYYGGAPQGPLRRDLPVLFILAEGDMAGGLGPQAVPLWQRVTESRAPWTLTFASRQPHAFDAFEDSDESRRIVKQTIDFWKTHLEPTPAPPWKPSEARAIVSSIYMNDRERAIELLRRYIQTSPSDAQAHLQLGRMYQQSQKLDDAAASFEKARSLDADNPAIYSGIGQIRFAQRRYEDAVTNLSRAADAGFRNSLIYGQIGFSQLALGQNEAAIASYDKAFELGIPPGANTRGVAYYNLACAYARLKNLDKAFEMINKAIDEGFANRGTLESDSDLASLRSDPRFKKALERLPVQTVTN